MLISHETPLQLMDKSRSYNDYDYALVHLFETHPQYYQFFKTSLAAGREVLLDNSIFELGTAFDPEKFYNYILDLNPTYYVVPDVLEDAQQTIISFLNWETKHDMNPIKHIPKIGVVQGKTYDELATCYTFMNEKADYIAISFDYSYYQQSALGKNKLEKCRNGRVKLIRDFINDGIWDETTPHHLLGCALPNEFKEYRNLTNAIRSLDTSNPVVAGMHNIRYIDNIGLVDKPSTKLCDLIDFSVTDQTKKIILKNVEDFRFINRIFRGTRL
jgi:hypothetical protein